MAARKGTPRVLYRSLLEFSDVSDQHPQTWPLCCGDPMPKHVTIYDSTPQRKSRESEVCEVMCFECFAKGVIDRTLLVVDA